MPIARWPVSTSDWAAVGAAAVLADVGVLTLLQQAVPEEVLARVFGVAGGALIGTVGIGSSCCAG
jgi:hypothetical protein